MQTGVVLVPLLRLGSVLDPTRSSCVVFRLCCEQLPELKAAPQ